MFLLNYFRVCVLNDKIRGCLDLYHFFCLLKRSTTISFRVKMAAKNNKKLLLLFNDKE